MASEPDLILGCAEEPDGFFRCPDCGLNLDLIRVAGHRDSCDHYTPNPTVPNHVQQAIALLRSSGYVVAKKPCEPVLYETLGDVLDVVQELTRDQPTNGVMWTLFVEMGNMLADARNHGTEARGELGTCFDMSELTRILG